jgi:hypothetical protein
MREVRRTFVVVRPCVVGFESLRRGVRDKNAARIWASAAGRVPLWALGFVACSEVTRDADRDSFTSRWRWWVGR